MRLLTENEIKFLKDTGWTPTVYQCGNREWYRTIFCDEINEDQLSGDFTNNDEVQQHCAIYADEKYGIDLPAFYDDLVKDMDGISLEEEAPYIIYCLLTEEELDSKTDAELLQWLKDWKYFFGYRKADEQDARIARYEAKGLFNGAREVRTYDDGSIYISGLED